MQKEIGQGLQECLGISKQRCRRSSFILRSPSDLEGVKEQSLLWNIQSSGTGSLLIKKMLIFEMIAYVTQEQLVMQF